MVEVFARKFRKRLSETPLTKENFKTEILQIEQEIIIQLERTQAEYDIETEHCDNALQQLEWDKKIKHWLY